MVSKYTEPLHSYLGQENNNNIINNKYLPVFNIKFSLEILSERLLVHEHFH